MSKTDSWLKIIAAEKGYVMERKTDIRDYFRNNLEGAEDIEDILELITDAYEDYLHALSNLEKYMINNQKNKN